MGSGAALFDLGLVGEGALAGAENVVDDAHDVGVVVDVVDGAVVSVFLLLPIEVGDG
jgi:hypothetical protein